MLRSAKQGSMAEGEEQLCPRVTYHCENRTVEGLAGSLIACYVLVSSSALSCLGAVLIVVAYFAIKEIRRAGAQTIITVLAVADFVYSGSLIIAGINFFVYYKETVQENCKDYQTVCKIQGFITLLGSWSTFVWTTVLAFYFFMHYVFRRGAFAMKLMPVYNLVAWGLPAVIGLTLLVLDKLGLYPGWLVCNTKPQGSQGENVLLLLLGGWLPEIVSLFFVLGVYMFLFVLLCKQRGRISLGPSVDHLEKKLLAIPIIYIFLRVWNTVEFILLSVKPPFLSDPCTGSDNVHTFFYVVTILQVIADSSQGWVNTILYVFLSKKMRERLFWNPAKRLRAKLCTGHHHELEQRPPQRLASIHRNNTASGAKNNTSSTDCFLPPEFPDEFEDAGSFCTSIKRLADNLCQRFRREQFQQQQRPTSEATLITVPQTNSRATCDRSTTTYYSFVPEFLDEYDSNQDAA